MSDRLVAVLLLWGMRFGLTRLIAHEYLTFVSEKLNVVSNALGAM